jgi:hypothetical protein
MLPISAWGLFFSGVTRGGALGARVPPKICATKIFMLHHFAVRRALRRRTASRRRAARNRAVCFYLLMYALLRDRRRML